MFNNTRIAIIALATIVIICGAYLRQYTIDSAKIEVLKQVRRAGAFDRKESYAEAEFQLTCFGEIKKRENLNATKVSPAEANPADF